MTHYPGTRSLDAEIILNSIEGTVTMDYSLNKFGSPYKSSTSTVLKSEWREAKMLTKHVHLLYRSIAYLIIFFIEPFVMPAMTFLVNHGIIKNPRYQFNHQKLVKWCLEKAHGTYQQSQTGILKDSVLKFYILRNVWFHYELSGEYQSKIKSISFMRNFVSFKKFGKFREERQRGWNIVFEFTDPPRHGSATITYV